MMKFKSPGLSPIALTMLAVVCLNATAEEAVVSGEDLTQPIDRFDIRMQFKSLPDAPLASGGTINDVSEETLTLRTDLLFFKKPDQLSLRFDLPLIWTNKPEKDNPGASTDFGLGDILMQAIYVREIDSRWAAGIGMQTLLPTATGDGQGTGKWQLVPTLGVRASLPEISPGSYAGVILRQYNSVAGSSSRKNINNTGIEPQLNIGLPDRWFLNTSPKLIYNRTTGDWFVPLDLMIGKKFGERWIASIEYQFGLVRDYDSYDEWVEARLGYYF
ncbi:MAG: hypothetical protein ABIS50_08740 [Luteolibacter sp.]|uniref:hypothetical protein n=1 Tax=Luteolibacter sp. TaxID=1962973 RepID=UPI00326308E0